MTSVSFNSDYNTIDDPKYRFAIHGLEESNVRMGVLIQEPGFSIGNIDQWLFKDSIIGRNQFVGFLRKLLKARLKATGVAHGEDIFSFLQQCKDPETGDQLAPMDLSTETALLVVAGKLLLRLILCTNCPHVYIGQADNLRRI